MQKASFVHLKIASLITLFLAWHRKILNLNEAKGIYVSQLNVEGHIVITLTIADTLVLFYIKLLNDKDQ